MDVQYKHTLPFHCIQINKSINQCYIGYTDDLVISLLLKTLLSLSLTLSYSLLLSLTLSYSLVLSLTLSYSLLLSLSSITLLLLSPLLFTIPS